MKIGGGDDFVSLRAPLCGAFYAAAVYPLLPENNPWGNNSIPIQWIAKFPEELLNVTLGNIQKVFIPYCIPFSYCLTLFN